MRKFTFVDRIFFLCAWKFMFLFVSNCTETYIYIRWKNDSWWLLCRNLKMFWFGFWIDQPTNPDPIILWWEIDKGDCTSLWWHCCDEFFLQLHFVSQWFHQGRFFNGEIRFSRKKNVIRMVPNHLQNILHFWKSSYLMLKIYKHRLVVIFY